MSASSTAISSPVSPHDLIGEAVERHDLAGGTARDRLLRHPEYHRACLILGYGRGARVFHFAQSAGAVVAHSGHDDAQGVGAGEAGGGTEQNVDGWPMPRHQLAVADRHVITRTAALQQHV